MKKSILLAGLILLSARVLFSQVVPFPTSYRDYNEISPWGYTNTGTTWNTAPFLPFIYKDMWYRLMPPNGVNPTITNNSDGSISSITFNYTEPGKKYPLILFFQGAGETGTNNNKQLLHGGERHKNAVLSGEFPGYLLYPQSVDYDKAKDLIDKLIATYPSIDINRIYVHGLSNGAKWTYQFAINNPTLVAAMAPMSGAAASPEDPDLLYTPIRLAQGGLDTNPAPSWTQSIKSWFDANGGHMEYFYFPTLGHGTWNTMYARSDFFSWFLNYKKNTIQVLYDKTEFCPGDPVSSTMGFTPGFDAYEWRKDGVLMNGETTHKITVTSFGLYTGRIKNRGEWSEWSDPIEIKVKAPTATPPIQLSQLQSVVIPDINGNSNVSLTLPAGYETYSYSKQGVGEIGTAQTIIVSSAGSYTATVKEFGGCSSNASVPFVIVNAAGTPKPDAISNLQVTTISKTQLRINWDNNISPTVNETGFEVYRSLAVGGPYTLISVTAPDVLIYNDNNLNANTTYYYKVRPVGANGAAVVSAAASGITDVDIIAPTAPNNLVVTSSSTTTVGLSWSASTDNVGVTSYDIFVRPAGQANYLKAYTTSNTTQLVSGLTYNTLYNFIVKAKDQAGNVSPASNQVNSPTVLTGLNYAEYWGTWSVLPDFNTLSPVNTGFVSTFSLTPATANPLDNFGFVFTGFLQVPTTGTYTFYTSSDDGSKLWVNNVLVVNNDGAHGTQERSGTITLSAGYYPIRCEFFEAGGGQALTVSWQGPGISKQAIPASRLKENFTLPAAPAAPSGLARTVLDYKSIRLNWNNYTGTGTEMEIYRSVTNTSNWNIIATIPATQNTYTSIDLSPSTRYYYRLRAVNSGNVSAYTSNVNGITTALPPIPAKPTGLQLVSVTANSASIAWTDASNNEDNFEVYKSLGNNASYAKVATLPANTTGYVDNSLFAHTLYYYKVVSKNVSGSSADSNEISTTSLNTAPILNPIADVVVRFDEELVIEVEATDADNDFLIFGGTPTSLPPFVEVSDYGDGTAYISIAPGGVAQIGEYPGVEIYVQDAFGGLHSVQFKIIVNSNHTPEVAIIAPQTVKETNILQFSITGSDADNDPITWSMLNAPSFLTGIANGNVFNLTAQPGIDHSGVYNVTVTATDINGASNSKTLALTVEDYDPDFNVKINLRTEVGYNGPSDWNNAGGSASIPSISDLKKEDGTSSGFSVSFSGSWELYRDASGVTPGIFPTNVNGSYLHFYGNTARTILIQNLDPQGKYNLKLLSSTKITGTYTTTFSVGGQSQSINPVNNASTLVVFNGLTPNAQGQLSISVQGPSNGYAIFNAFILESYYEGDTPPPAPSNLEVSAVSSAIQLTWLDNASSEQSQKIFRSTNGIDFIDIATLAKDVVIYTDANFIAGTTYYYKVQALNSIGASEFSNEASIVAPNRAPIILPVAPISMPEQDMQWIEVSATDADGDALTFSLENEPGFMWSEYVDETKVNLVFAPSEGDHGSYQFLLHCDDPSGSRATATINLTIYSASDVEFKINFTSTGSAASPWNNISTYTANTVLSNLMNSNNISTSASITLVEGWTGPNPNGNNTGNNSGIYPDAVMASSFYIQDNSSRSILLSGLNPSKTYDFTFFASRMGVADVRNTIYSSGTKSAILNASGNTSTTASITAIKPNASGNITITVSRDPASAYGYLGAMIIREYDLVIVPTVPEKPVGLISQVLTRTSIKLNWQDVSTDETGFEIWRSIGNSTSYSLLASVGPNVTTYTNVGLSTSTLYYYKVAARNAVGLSQFSNETSGSTFDYSVSVNFNALNGPASGWNNITAFLSDGYVLNNLTDDTGSNSGISMTVVNQFAGDNPWGNNTGNDSGIVPDKVMAGSFWIDRAGVATLRFGGFSFLKKYNFSFFASRAADGDRNTIYTINGTSVTLNASNNTTNLVQIKDIEAELDGTITVTITTSQTALFGYLNGLIIQAVPNLGGGGARTAGKTLEEATKADLEAEAGKEIQVYPNPFVDRITMQLGSTAPKNFSVSVVNATGVVVFAREYDRKPEQSEIELLFREDLSEGLYILRVIESSGNSYNLRLLKK
jgi:large repetitive protein